MKNPYKVEFPSRGRPKGYRLLCSRCKSPSFPLHHQDHRPKLQKATDGQYRKFVWLSACVSFQSGRALAAVELQAAAANRQENMRGARGLRDGAQPPAPAYKFDVKGSDPDYDSQPASSSTNGLSSEAWLNDDAHDSDVDLLGWLRGRECDYGSVRNLSFSFSNDRSAAHFLESALSPIATEYIEPQLLSVGDEVHMTIDQYLNARQPGHKDKIPLLKRPCQL